MTGITEFGLRRQIGWNYGVRAEGQFDRNHRIQVKGYREINKKIRKKITSTRTLQFRLEKTVFTRVFRLRNMQKKEKSMEKC